MPDELNNSSEKKKRVNARKIPTTLTRKELAAAVAKRLGETPEQVSEYVDATIDSLANLIKSANPELRIELRGLGVFEVKFMKLDATVRDPRTGDEIAYSGRRRKMHFRPSKIIKRILQDDSRTANNRSAQKSE